MSGLVVALDGPGSSGKSSVGAAAAVEVGYRFFDTGLLYRAATWLAIRRGVGEADPEALVGLLDEIELAPDDAGRLARVLVDGADVTAELRSPEVDVAVSAISRVPDLRAALLERQRTIAADGRIVMAGRDIGTVVLPDADLKVFLDASPEERARRRTRERGLPADGPEGAEVLADLRRRDGLDSSRAVAPLRPAADARQFRTDGNRFEETVALVVGAIREAEATAGAPEPERAPAPERAPEPKPGREPEPHARAAEIARDDAVPLQFRFGSLLARLLVRSITRVRFSGAIDEVPRIGPAILAVNHASNADPVMIAVFLTQRFGRRIHWLGKREVFDWPVVGWIASQSSVHPVERGAADVEAFRTVRKLLDDGHLLAVFPEGTRSPDGRLQSAKEGLAVLALRTGAPIIPIGISGSHRVWPKGQKLPHPGGRITVNVGSPFRLDELLAAEPDAPLDRRAAKERATTLMMRRIAALLPPDQRGAYGDGEAPVTA